MAQSCLRGFRYAAAIQASFVDGSDLRRAAVRQHKGRHVLAQLRTAAHHGKPAHAAKLMNRDVAPEHRVVLDLDVAGQASEVGENDMVAERTIVRDVGVGQQVVVRTNPGDAAVFRCAVNRDALSKRVPVTDFNPG